jgi:hypothetical protein
MEPSGKLGGGIRLGNECGECQVRYPTFYKVMYPFSDIIVSENGRISNRIILQVEREGLFATC